MQDVADVVDPDSATGEADCIGALCNLDQVSDLTCEIQKRAPLHKYFFLPGKLVVNLRENRILGLVAQHVQLS